MKCSNCNRKAMYDSPRMLCSKHWVQWWHEGPKKARAPKGLKAAIQRRQTALAELATMRERRPMTQTELLHLDRRGRRQDDPATKIEGGEERVEGRPPNRPWPSKAQEDHRRIRIGRYRARQNRISND